jgi:hypothetical protein
VLQSPHVNDSAHEFDKLLEQQSRLYIFQPLTTHSFKEAKWTIRFHAQMIADFLTIEEIAFKIGDELTAT